MPLYVYRCMECLKQYEVHMTIKELEEDKKVECPHCQKELQRIIKPVYFKIN